MPFSFENTSPPENRRFFSPTSRRGGVRAGLLFCVTRADRRIDGSCRRSGSGKLRNKARSGESTKEVDMGSTWGGFGTLHTGSDVFGCMLHRRTMTSSLLMFLTCGSGFLWKIVPVSLEEIRVLWVAGCTVCRYIMWVSQSGLSLIPSPVSGKAANQLRQRLQMAEAPANQAKTPYPPSNCPWKWKIPRNKDPTPGARTIHVTM